ncbi:hypothetical protein L6164_036861 [Bauhinia variegata]|uniref:Uncharacterized protein n=1 Tax=Bauhinia variegata TaxID=167791 RepID=A0ACB9KIJ4_BAUVA|nr:hypothetical protein L6164_036861 [Bauhinia variegata]
MMNENLKVAAEADSTDLLYAQIQVDPYILERIDAIPFIHTPLHTAAAAGKIRFATEIMRLKPSFAWKLNEHGLSPMHVALQNQNFSLVRRLVDINKDVIRVKGKDGITPLHLVSQAGNVEILAEFLSACPESIVDVTVQSESALHLAAKHGQVEALTVSVCWLTSNCKSGALDLQNSILNWKDEDDNTILHILVSRNDTNSQIIQLLIQGKMNLNSKNSARLTAMDIVENQNQDNANIVKIKEVLHSAKALRGDSVFSAPTLAETLVRKDKVTLWRKLKNVNIKLNRLRESITNETRNILLVVAVLVASSTNQAALSPPGGVYQSEVDPYDRANYSPGETVMSMTSFHVFWSFNTLALLASALAIYILLPAAGGVTLLLIFPLVYFVIGFFFSMHVIGPPFSVSENPATNGDADGHDQRRNQPPSASMVNDSLSLNIGEPSYRLTSSMDNEREEWTELWSVDEEHWMSVPTRGVMGTCSSDTVVDSEDSPLHVIE